MEKLVDEKTIMELYAPPFATAAAHKVAGYMCAYNRINHVWACEQPETLKTMLKGYFNFSGFVVRLKSEAFQPDMGEIKEAQWFSIAHLLGAWRSAGRPSGTPIISVE